MSDPQPAALLREVAAILDSLKIRWCLGGSLAAAFYGVTRATRDIDVIIDVAPEAAEPLARALEQRLYVSRVAMNEALRERRSFNAVDADSGFKIDFFVLGDSSFDRKELEGRRMLPLAGADGMLVPTKSLEDSILRKLLWYRDGGGVSDLQWSDVLTLLRTNSERLDERHLEEWAGTLGIRELLSKARSEASR